jgi:hypothetical protein
MGLEILLAVAAALVAIYGIARDLKPGTKRILIGLAVVIAVATATKAYVDDRDKDLMKAALVGTLVPTPATIATMYELIKDNALTNGYGYSKVDYMRIDGGMVVYLDKAAGSPEAVVLDRLDIASLYAKILMEEGSSGVEKTLWRYIPALGYHRDQEALISKFLKQAFRKQDFDETGYSENLYGRLCILAQTSARQVLRRRSNDCDYDDKIGMTLTFDIAGQTHALNISAKDITQKFTVEEANARVLFAELDMYLRSEIKKLESEAH